VLISRTGHRGTQPITFNRFVQSLGGVSGCVKWGVFDDSSLNAEATAKNMCNDMTKPRPDHSADDAHVKNFGAKYIYVRHFEVERSHQEGQ
jgi:hypothetical protein